MKKILGVIGAVFVRIWTWIKETAWVQPLLIVGLIFAVIFSIPSITDWIQGIASDVKSAETYYKKYQKSLKNDENSDAQKLIDAIMNNEDTYGDKFFLMLVRDGCAGCDDIKPAFELLQKKTKNFYNPDELGKFKFYTIFVDQEVDTDLTNTAWDRLLDRNAPFLERAADVAESSWYYVNGHLDKSRIEGLEDGSNIVTPTLFLYDITDNNPFDPGLSEVMFGVSGNTSYEKATLLSHAWRHSDEFSS